MYSESVGFSARAIAVRSSSQEAHHAAAPPDFGDVGEVQIEALLFGKLFAGGVFEDVEAFGIGLHQSVLDAVVHHLDEVSGAGGAAVDIAFFGGAGQLVAARGAGNVAASGSQRFEDRIELLHHFVRAADHHAVAAVESPDAAAGADVDVVDSFFAELRAARRMSSLK